MHVLSVSVKQEAHLPTRTLGSSWAPFRCPLRELRVLNLGWCGAVDDADMVAVGQLAQLQDLQISYTQASSGLGSLQ